MSEHLPQCWTQDIGGMKRASAESCAVCDPIRSAVADALHEYDKQTYERCAKHMRTARREALDAAREAVVSCHLRLDSGKILRQGGDWENAIDKACRAIDALRTKP